MTNLNDPISEKIKRLKQLNQKLNLTPQEKKEGEEIYNLLVAENENLLKNNAHDRTKTKRY